MSTSSSSRAVVDIPKPEKVVMYGFEKRRALFLYGDPKSEKIAILCAGYADDHSIFQPFAYELAKQVGNSTLVGVICLPGYDHRPEDGVSWESHNRDGYSFNEWSNSIRDAVKALRNESTFHKGVHNTKFTGIFHDWAVIPGTMWLNRTLKEAEEQQKEKKASSPPVEDIFKPNNVVFFDVLLGPSSTMKGVPKEGEYVEKSVKEDICEWLYRIVFAVSFLLQRYISKYLAAVVFIGGNMVLTLLGLSPCYQWDIDSIEPLYKKKPKSLFRMMYMAYPYKAMFMIPFQSTSTPNNKKNQQQNNDTLDDFTLHDDWKATPILYMYGIKKRTQFHDNRCVQMLKREEEKQQQKTNNEGSKSKVIAVKDAGHFLYVQKPKFCLSSVIEFMDA